MIHILTDADGRPEHVLEGPAVNVRELASRMGENVPSKLAARLTSEYAFRRVRFDLVRPLGVIAWNATPPPTFQSDSADGATMNLLPPG